MAHSGVNAYSWQARFCSRWLTSQRNWLVCQVARKLGYHLHILYSFLQRPVGNIVVWWMAKWILHAWPSNATVSLTLMSKGTFPVTLFGLEVANGWNNFPRMLQLSIAHKALDSSFKTLLCQSVWENGLDRGSQTQCHWVCVLVSILVSDLDNIHSSIIRWPRAVGLQIL